MRTLPLLAIVAALCLAMPHVAEADDSPTLARIKERGEVVLGHRDSSVPFSYLDQNQQPVGYSIDLCLRAVDAVKQALEMPNLRVRYNPVTSATRIPLVANGTVDMECGSTVNNAERQQQVSFSYTTFIVGTRFIAKKTSNFKTLNDLKGKTVVCTAGTNTIARVHELNNKRNLGMTILSGKDHAESFLMVESGRAAAFFEDDILLAGLAANSRTPSEWSISTEGYSVDPYALMLPHGDAGFKRVVDRALADTFRSGAIKAIYDKWFVKPIPPKGVTLDFPLSPALKKAFEKPTDSPDPGAYD
ncbi:MAG TPA: amino acid ABC transporter substrate-binding protein [Casimicrobiaceae bacterium]|jgi:glutamate/aspartate transport system substrate-binding protein